MSATMLIFLIDGREYALPIDAVVEVAGYRPPTAVPGAGPGVLGVLTRRGRRWPASAEPVPGSRAAAESSPSGKRPAQAGAAPGGAGPLALVADEDREFRDLVARSLESLGCRVETTDDGEAAFRFAVTRRPAVMIVNVYLRRLLGVAVCEGVKGSPDLRGTRVALVGSVFKSDRFVRSPGNLYGADDYFDDVIHRDELRVTLSSII